MGINLNPVINERKFELANAVAILSLASSIPLSGEMTPAQQSAVLGDKLSTIGATSSTEFLDATSDAILNPGGYTNIVTAIMDLLAKVNSQTPGTIQNKKNVVTVSSMGGDYATINEAIGAINAGLFGAPAANNICLIQVFPGIYMENIVLPDFINIVGENLNSVIVHGNVERNSIASGMITNLSIKSDTSFAFSVLAEGECMLHGLKIENSGGGAALLVDNENAIVSTDAIELVSHNGTALTLSSGKAISKNTFFVGHDGVVANNGATFVFAGGEIQAVNNGIYCDSSSEVVTMFGNIKAGAYAAKTEGGTLRLLGGIFAGNIGSISADDFSTVFLGAITAIPQTPELANAVVIPNALAEGIAFKDDLGLFGHSLETLKSLKGILIELGQARVQHEKDIGALHDKSNHNEQDSLVDNAMIQISLMPANYTMFMVDSFMDINTNTYPDGDDKALVLAKNSVLAHQDNAVSLNFYKQVFNGNMTAKNKIYLKAAMQKGMEDAMGAHDWQIDFCLEVVGGRYGTTPVTFMLHSANVLNWNDGRVEKELTLMNPISGNALTPIIGAGEQVSIKIIIKSDNAILQATPVVRSFVAFV